MKIHLSYITSITVLLISLHILKNRDKKLSFDIGLSKGRMEVYQSILDKKDDEEVRKLCRFRICMG